MDDVCCNGSEPKTLVTTGPSLSGSRKGLEGEAKLGRDRLPCSLGSRREDSRKVAFAGCS